MSIELEQTMSKLRARAQKVGASVNETDIARMREENRKMQARRATLVIDKSWDKCLATVNNDVYHSRDLYLWEDKKRGRL